MSNITLDDENPLQMFLYALRAPESKRQYPRRLKVVLDYLKSKGELRTDILEHQCREFIMKTRENPKWANNQLMQFVLFQKGRVESGEIVSTTIQNYIKAAKLFLEMNFDVPLVNWKRITKFKHLFNALELVANKDGKKRESDVFDLHVVNLSSVQQTDVEEWRELYNRTKHADRNSADIETYLSGIKHIGSKYLPPLRRCYQDIILSLL